MLWCMVDDSGANIGAGEPAQRWVYWDLRLRRCQVDDGEAMRTIREEREAGYRRRRRRVDRRREGTRSGGLPRRTGDGGRERMFRVSQYGLTAAARR